MSLGVEKIVGMTLQSSPSRKSINRCIYQIWRVLLLVKQVWILWWPDYCWCPSLSVQSTQSQHLNSCTFNLLLPTTCFRHSFIFPFCTWFFSTWWRSNEWPKHEVGSNNFKFWILKLTETWPVLMIFKHIESVVNWTCVSSRVVIVFTGLSVINARW